VSTSAGFAKSSGDQKGKPPNGGASKSIGAGLKP
jgi:hypothetical protein